MKACFTQAFLNTSLLHAGFFKHQPANLLKVV